MSERDGLRSSESYGRILRVEGVALIHLPMKGKPASCVFFGLEKICLYCCFSSRDRALDLTDEFTIGKCFRGVYLMALLLTYRLETTMSTARFDPLNRARFADLLRYP